MKCQHKAQDKIIDREDVYWKCRDCGERIVTLRLRFLKFWSRYQRWRGEGYGFTNFFKEFMLNMVQGGMILTTFKVMWDITLSWQFLVIFFILWEVLNVWLGNVLIYKVKLPEAMADYNERTEVLSPVRRGMLDDLTEIKQDVKDLKNDTK